MKALHQQHQQDRTLYVYRTQKIKRSIHMQALKEHLINRNTNHLHNHNQRHAEPQKIRTTRPQSETYKTLEDSNFNEQKKLRPLPFDSTEEQLTISFVDLSHLRFASIRFFAHDRNQFPSLTSSRIATGFVASLHRGEQPGILIASSRRRTIDFHRFASPRKQDDGFLHFVVEERRMMKPSKMKLNFFHPSVFPPKSLSPLHMSKKNRIFLSLIKQRRVT